MQQKCKDEQFIYDDFWYWNIDHSIKHHDLSKYSAQEFTQYRNSFYPCAEEDVDKDAFDEAWRHHYETNPHHWEYWVNDDGTFKYVGCEDYSKITVGKRREYETIYAGYVEMVCDWTAMGYKFGDSALSYYEKNKAKIKIVPEWTELVEAIMKKMA